MAQKIVCRASNPPLAGIAASELVKSTNPIEIEWGQETAITFNASGTKFTFGTDNDLLRVIARVATKHQLYGNVPVEQSLVDQWLTFSTNIHVDLPKALHYLQKCLAPLTYLVANRLTIADLAVHASLYRNIESKKENIELPTHVKRWYELIGGQECVKLALASLPAEAKQALKTAVAKAPVNGSVSTERKQEGKFVELPGAEMGKVVVRFPPEASGYLHIGHAKAALLNQYYQQAFDGKLIMRFDDTNPAKETIEFEQVILGDLEMLEVKPDLFTHTSQYFDLMLQYCEQLLKEGKAYVDNTEPEQMKKEREQRIESPNRSNSYEKNFKMWQEMLKGSAVGSKCCVRAKIDMASHNGCMRDPTIYRCKNEPHPRTGTQYKVYPTYDFACPIVDAIEGVTHTLRTMEYHDRDAQFYWFIEALNLRRPYIWEYSRLNMTNTVLSKRKLTWFVENKLVDGWDDPRFPTVRGVLRRGMTVKGLKEFIIAQGGSKSVVFMEWDKIWAFNKKVIDPIAPRYTALTLNDSVVVNVSGVAKAEKLQVAAHPKNPDVGQKTIWIGPRILIDRDDAEALKEGENATFINWGNLTINKVNRSASGKIINVDATTNLDNKDYKKTLKLTWLYEGESASDFPPTYCVYFEHIIGKAVLTKDEDFKQYIGHETRREVAMLGDPELKSCKEGDIIQLQRRGFFRVDQAYAPPSVYTGKATPVVLFEIPDGSQAKEKTAATAPVNKKSIAGPTVAVTAVQPKSDLIDRIVRQGNIVRDLKTQKAEKSKILPEVNTLLALKVEYKNKYGKEWTPDAAVPVENFSQPDASSGSDLNDLITKQGNLVRDLKTQKADKPKIEEAVKALLALKINFKAQTGKDWTPNAAVAAPVAQAVDDLVERIAEQGNVVRDLKSQKAEKSKILHEVNTLLALKVEYKNKHGKDWTPDAVVPAAVAPTATVPHRNLPQTDASSGIELNDRITKQGNLVRDLKTQKADKEKVNEAVQALLALKAEFKTQTGTDWKPAATTTASIPAKTTVIAAAPSVNSSAASILDQISKQGEIVRTLKSAKADKSKVEAEVQTLLSLKAKYKEVTGTAWTANATAPTTMAPTAPAASSNTAVDGTKAGITAKIAAQGDTVRSLKTAKASAADIDQAVKALLELKLEYKNVTGEEFPTPGRGASSKPKSGEKAKSAEKPKQQPKAAPKAAPADASGDAALKKVTRLGLEATKETNLPEWYSQVLTKGEMIEYYDVSGCYILRHWSFAIWKVIQRWFTDEIDKLGVKEVYFPLFVSRAALEKEKDHIADFSPEVAWVTKSGDSDLSEPVAIRPTSETIMYPTFAKWVQSYRDLPIRINQWSNVVRWEFKHPQPFLRTREFLWQEGHSAWENQDDAHAEVLTMLDLYARVYTDLLAIPVIKGRKTEKEKFAGGDYTTTVEAYVSASGRAIQGATSHHLGQNFSKMFDIVFEHPETKEKQFAYQNSYGLTTRTIGVMIMVHADNKGLVLPPNVACIQAIIVPCGLTVNTKPEERDRLLESCRSLEATLKSAGVRAEADFRENYSPGWKFNHWELKGVPIRIEIGPKDLSANQLVAVRRDNGDKLTIPLNEVAARVPALLKQIHESMFAKANKDLGDHVKVTKTWDEFGKGLDKNNLLLSPFCGDKDCEGRIKDESARDESELEAGALAMGAKSLCFPFEQPASMTAADKCIHPACKLKPTSYCLFGRSY